MKEIKNAIIEGTMLGYEDHGIMTCYLYLSYGGGGQGFGGFALDEPKKNKKGEFIDRFGTAQGMQFIKEILKVVGVEKWEDLKGKHIRVEAEDHQIYRIGNILKDEWFDPRSLWE